MRVGGELTGQVAIVTGAAAGIGRAVLEMLAAEGARVVALDIDAAGAAQAVAALTDAGGVGAWEAVDVASTDNMRACCTRIHEEFGRIDILVNNAAVGAAGALPDVTEAMFDRLFSVNVRGAFFAAQAAVAAMKLNGGGRIINISSLIAAKGVAANSHYAGAKAALIGFTRAWAVELAPFGVTVNAVLPALTPTPMTYKAFDADELSRRAAAVPMKRLGTPEDVAAAVRYFCSPGAAFVTGQSISPNGAEFVGAL